MTLQEYQRLANEFQMKVVPLVKSMLMNGKVRLTTTAEASLRGLLRIEELDDFPYEIFKYDPISTEIQYSLNDDAMFILANISIPRKVGKTFNYKKENHTTSRCVLKIMPDYVLLISATEVNPFRKLTVPSLILEKRSQDAKCHTKSTTVDKITEESV